MKKDLKETLKSHNRKNLLKEAFIMALLEQEQVAPGVPALPSPPPSVNAPPTPQEMQAQQNPQDAPPPVVPPPVSAQPILLDTLIERFNIIRGGKSFTNPDVYGQMASHFKSLSDQDKAVIGNYLDQVSKIVTNAPEAVQAPSPESAAPAPVPPPQSNTPQPPVVASQSPTPAAPAASMGAPSV